MARSNRLSAGKGGVGMTFRALACLVLSTIATARLTAEEVPQDLVLGMRVRVAAPALGPGPLVGAIMALDSKHMTLRVPGRTDPLSLDRANISRIELSVGRRSRGRGALVGAAAGAAAGVLLSLVTYGGRSEQLFSRGGDAIVSAAALGSAGALVGVALPPRERWKGVPLGGPSPAAALGSRAAVSLSFAF